MFGSAQPETPLPPRKETATGGDVTVSPDLAALPVNGDRSLESHELEAALQLLVERAQYITGATGAALALAEGEEMICRASIGPSGPGVGARLQVRSGLTGESIARKQLLRCDNAESDPRVNLETCRQLGIASIVVKPLLTHGGQVRGLFELFSDHAYAFEERDLVALERMADLTMTAIDLAQRRPVPVPPPVRTPDPIPIAPPLEVSPAPENLEAAPVIPVEKAPDPAAQPAPAVAPEGPLGSAVLHSALQEEALAQTPATPVPEAMRRVRKCDSCGFPVSEGRTLCLDCENKRHGQADSHEVVPDDLIPAFLASSPPPDESWLANHVNLLAVLVLVLSIVVAIVVFR